MLVEHHKTNSVSNNQQIFLSDTDLRVSYMCAFNVIHIGPTNLVSNNQQIFLSDTDLRVSYMCAFNVIYIGPTQEFGDLSCEQCSLVGDFFKISLSSEYSLQCI